MLFPLVHGVAFVLYLFTWGLLYAQQRRAPANRALRWFLLNMLLWVGSEFALHLPWARGWELVIWRVGGLFWIPCTFWFLHFVYRLTHRPIDWAYRLVAAGAFVSAALYVVTDWGAVGSLRHEWGVIDVRGPGHALFSLVPFAGGLVSIWLLAREMRRARNPRLARSILLILIGGLLALGAGMLANVVLPDFLGYPHFPRIASSAVVLILPFFHVAVLRQGFLTFDVQQAAEEMFEDLPDGVVLVDPAGEVRRMNAAARRLLRADAPGDAAGDLREWIERVPRDPPESPRELTLGAGDEARVVSVSRFPTRRESVAIGEIVIVRDLTEQRRAEAVLRRSRDELEQAVVHRTRELRQAQKMEAIGTLAGGIAHDFNNLLAAILGFAAAARDDLPERHAIREDIDEVIVAARRARDIVQQLLAFSGREKAELRPLDLRRVAREALRLVEVSVPDAVHVIARADAEEVVVLGDAAQLHQVTMNLVTNAVQAMAGRGGRLEVDVDRLDGEAVGRLTVSDRGAGIAPEVRARIFEPFFTTKEARGGTGLGLATAQRIIGAHGGRIEVTSEVGEGSTFEVRLPLADRPPERVEAPEPEVRAGTERILFIDDKPQLVRVVRRMLGPLGYRLETFTDPKRALEALERDPAAYDLVITDQMMPQVTGLEVAARARELRPELPVVLMSGNAGPEVRERGRAAGIAAFLDKPLTKAQLAEVVRRELAVARNATARSP